MDWNTGIILVYKEVSLNIPKELFNRWTDMILHFKLTLHFSGFITTNQTEIAPRIKWPSKQILNFSFEYNYWIWRGGGGRLLFKNAFNQKNFTSKWA